MKYIKSILFGLLLAYTNGYIFYNLQDYEVCTSDIVNLKVDLDEKEPTIKLKNGEKSAVKIDQEWNQKTWKMVQSNCSFLVKSHTPNRGGIYIFISKMKLRKDIAGKCIDYVQFSGGGEGTSDQLCGEMEKNRPKPIQFNERKGEVFVNVYARPIYHSEPLELSMIFTSYSVCETLDDFECNIGDNISCIYKHFINDGIPNCLPPCQDETGTCLVSIATARSINSWSIIIGALTSLIFTMVGVGSCIWICWKYRECLRDTPTPSRRHSEDIPTIEMPSSPAAGAGSNTAPPIKDLPPSYESLFPAG